MILQFCVQQEQMPTDFLAKMSFLLSVSLSLNIYIYIYIPIYLAAYDLVHSLAYLSLKGCTPQNWYTYRYTLIGTLAAVSLHRYMPNMI